MLKRRDCDIKIKALDVVEMWGWILIGCGIVGFIDAFSSRQILWSNSALFAKSSQSQQAKGFGGSSKNTPTKEKPWKVELDAKVEKELTELEAQDKSLDIRTFLNPELFNDPSTMEQIQSSLAKGEVVVLRNAFKKSFAEAAYCQLSSEFAPWALNEAYFPDGYAHKHSNIYDQSKWTERLNKTFSVFQSDATKDWISKISGRDCSGDCTGSPSLYRAGDHSLPHTDWIGQRTVAYVWHLSKDWLPEWGGALYWAQNLHANATFPASFNTLVLFGVTTKSAHFVTTVSPRSTGKRLTFNGWWQSSWIPRSGDDYENIMATREQRSGVTHFQLQAISEMLVDKWVKLTPEKRETLNTLRQQVMKEFYSVSAD